MSESATPVPAAAGRSGYGLLLACFFLSGFAALIYQTAWMRNFAFVFGTSELAVATVLAAYMAGLALGAAVAARFGRHVRRPVLVYALLELGIAVAALGVPLALDGATQLYVALFGAQDLPDAGGLRQALFYLACSFGILLVPTALMGATLPLLARHAVRSESQIGSRVGTLYATNTLGAVCGTLFTGFLLLPTLGLARTIGVAIAANALVFLAAVLLHRRVGPATHSAETPLPPQLANQWILPLALLSGVVSFSYEVVWTRLLGHVLGGSVYAFSTMLASFLVGIAAGSAIAARFASSPARALRGFAWAQLGVAVFSLAAFLAMDLVPSVFRWLDQRAAWSLLADASLCAAVLLPSTLCVGATFPFAVRILARDSASASPASGRVFAWNTAGAVLGAVGAGFFVVPALGFANTVALAAATSLGLAALTALLAAPRLRIPATLGVLGIGLLAVVRPPPPWDLIRTGPIAHSTQRGEIVFYEVGRSATVALVDVAHGWRLTTNGLPEAVIARRGLRRPPESVVSWLGGLGPALRPSARSLLVVGLGAGEALEGVPPSISEIDVAELEPQVVAANRFVAGQRRADPYDDPRVRVVVNDARGALLLADRRYDVIVSQPSHPWTAGASHLYTREFFELAEAHLSDGGVFVQWMGLRFIDLPLFRTLLATLGEVFPHVQVYAPTPGAVLFASSRKPLPDPIRDGARLLPVPELALHLPEDFASSLLLDEAGVRRMAEGAPICSDDRNWMAMRSPAVTRGSDPEATRATFDAVLAGEDPLLAAVEGLDGVALVRRLLTRGFRARAGRLADSLEDPTEAALGAAFVQVAQGKASQAAAGLARRARARPDDPRLAAARTFAVRRAGGSRAASELDNGPRGAAAPLDRAVIEGWRLLERRAWPELAALEASLAAAQPSDFLFGESLRLRAHWRLESGTAAQRVEALALVDRMIEVDGDSIASGILRARASLRAGDPGASLSTLLELASRLRRDRPRHRQLARAALDQLAEVPPDPERSALRAGLARRLRRIASAKGT